MARVREHCHRELIPLLAMVGAETTNIGSSTVFKAALEKGLSYHIFMLYSFIISTLVFFPLSRIFQRQAKLPPLTVAILFKFAVLAFFGYAAQYLANIAIGLSNPTLGTAMSNVTPACTFILAVILRMEKIELRSWSSQMKIFGTLLTIAGAFVIVLYNGPVVHSSTPASYSLLSVSSGHSNWIRGGITFAVQYVFVTFWYIYQAKVIREYPAEMVMALSYNIYCTIFSLIDCVINERDLEAWKLKPDIRLVSIIYTATLGTTLCTVVHMWGLRVKGPVYVALFCPMTIVIAAIMGVIFLGDTLYLGCIIGSIIISMGFYAVIWGKSREERDNKSKDNDVESSINPAAPLLED